MKALKITFIVGILLASLTSCTKQDLTEEDLLESPETKQVIFTGGQGHD